jgi:hypothetical protein
MKSDSIAIVSKIQNLKFKMIFTPVLRQPSDEEILPATDLKKPLY